ncbi:MAG: hypothetical protein ACLFT8_01560 [Desulfovermiculus sp.]
MTHQTELDLLCINTIRTLAMDAVQRAGSGEPLGPDEIRSTQERLERPLDPPFFIPDQALEHFRQALTRGDKQEKEWQSRFEAYAPAFPELTRK